MHVCSRRCTVMILNSKRKQSNNEKIKEISTSIMKSPTKQLRSKDTSKTKCNNNRVDSSKDSESLLPLFFTGNSDLESIVNCLQDRKNIVVLVGAGISVSCGIPDFRSKGTGLYETLDIDELGLETPEELFNYEVFMDDPSPFYKFAPKLLFPPKPYVPSASHNFLAYLDQRKKLLRVYTQNIDGLEENAGVSPQRVIYAHGSLFESKCLSCGFKLPTSELQSDILAGNIPRCRKLKKKRKNDLTCNKSRTINNKIISSTSQEDDKSQPQIDDIACQKVKRNSGATDAPIRYCFTRSHSSSNSSSTKSTGDISSTHIDSSIYCNGIIKPNITFFGEKLTDKVSNTLKSDRSKADALIIMGTSLSVAPMSKIIHYLSSQIPRILINRTVITPQASNNSNVTTKYINNDNKQRNSQRKETEENDDNGYMPKDYREGYIFDACLLGNCDEVTSSLRHIMEDNNDRFQHKNTRKKGTNSKPKLCNEIKNNNPESTIITDSCDSTNYEKISNIVKKWKRQSNTNNNISNQEVHLQRFKKVAPLDYIFLFPGASIDELGYSTLSNPSLQDQNNMVSHDKQFEEDIVFTEIVHCNSCNEVIIGDVIMKCVDCFDYDLCQDCYVVDERKHFGGVHKFIEERNLYN